MEVFPLVNNFDGTNWIDVSAFLSSRGAGTLPQRSRHFWRRTSIAGLMVDFEEFPKKAQPGYLALLRALSELHARE